jgi:ABC-type sugar transport system permease subunit
LNSLRKNSRKRASLSRKDAVAGFLFILLWLIGTIYFFIKPFITVILYSFHDVPSSGYLNESKFVGFDVFVRVFTTDTTFIRSFFESITGIFTTAIFVIFFSVFVALILKSEFRGRTLVRAIFFLPVIIATGPIMDIINSETLAQSLMSGESTSIMFQVTSIEELLLQIGLSQELTSTFSSMVSEIFNLSWKAGIQILLFMAALQNVPSHLYEAADVEGASGWEKFWLITFPMITPILLLNTIYTVIEGFTDYSNKIIQMIVSQTQNLNLSYAAALGTSYFSVVFIIIMVIYLIINRRSFYMQK